MPGYFPSRTDDRYNSPEVIIVSNIVGLVITAKVDNATKYQMTTLMVDPNLWSPPAGGIIVAIAPVVRIPNNYPKRCVVLLRSRWTA